MIHYRFLITWLCLFVTGSAALSAQQNPIRQVSVVEEPTIVAPSKRVHYHTKFDLHFKIRNEEGQIRLALEPNHDVLHEAMHVNYVRADGTVGRAERLRRHEHKVFRGHAFIRRAGRAEWTKAGWARITMHRDGEHPIFEGAFQLDGDHHHVQTGRSYRRAKRSADPEPEGVSDSEEYMTVWRDSDVMIEDHERRDADDQPACGADALNYDAHLMPSFMQSQDADPETLFARQIDSGNGQAGWDLRDTIGETRGCPNQRQVALVGIATDCTYTAGFNSPDEVRSHVVGLVNSASEVYESSFNISLGIRNLTISESSCPSESGGSAPWNVGCNANLDIRDRLSIFSEWRGSQNDGNAFWTLMSTCGSGSSVGIAWLGQVCTRGSRQAGQGQRVAGANVVVRTRSEWQVFAHEAGHTFGAVHDCEERACGSSGTVGQACCPLSENSCDARGRFLMNPSARQDLSAFSPCSIGNICFGLRRLFSSSSCLTNNRNVETISEAQCGNGIVEVGEDCDCGGDDECGDNPCCDAQTCTFVGDAVCDPSNEACCSNQCTFASQGTTCRPSTGGCDPEETCPGDSGTCPDDELLSDGDSCGEDGQGLRCAAGQCTSRDEQCQAAMGARAAANGTTACDGGCMVRCRNPTAFDSDTCRNMNQYFLDGTPCGDDDGMCQNGDCRSPDRSTIGSFWRRNDHILIPVIASVGGLIVLGLFICCVVMPCLRKRKAKKIPPPPPPARFVPRLYG